MVEISKAKLIAFILVGTIVSVIFLNQLSNLKTAYFYRTDLDNTTTISEMNITKNYHKVINPIFMDFSKGHMLQLVGKTNLSKSILWINKPSWVPMKTLNIYLTHNCPYNCIMTMNKKNIKDVDAIVFGAQDGLHHNPQLLKKYRPPEQVWVFLRKEPPAIFNMNWYRQPVWKNTMNWSWGYRFDSDIFFPNGKLIIHDKPKFRNYSSIFRRKKHMAAWAVSRCHTQSRRDEYVKLLQQEGVSVDVFGKCSNTRRSISWDELASLINREYKFYLAFESSFCKDYITEKFFKYFGLDTIVVVRGHLNYSEYFDKSTFINTADFSSIKEVANFIMNVGNNETMYTRYLRKKEYYEPTTGAREFNKSACVLCQKLNNLKQNKKIYGNISTYIHSKMCFAPRDLN